MGEQPGVPERGLLASNGDEWARAVHRAEVIGVPLVSSGANLVPSGVRRSSGGR